MAVESDAYVTFKDTVKAKAFVGLGGTSVTRQDADTLVAKFVAVGDLTDIGTATDTLTDAGVLTPKSSICNVYTYGGAVLDTITSITYGGPVGTLLYIKSANDSKDVAIIDGATIGVAGTDTLNTSTDMIVLMKVDPSPIWVEVSRSDN
jgi:hypothetical protein